MKRNENKNWKGEKMTQKKNRISLFDLVDMEDFMTELETDEILRIQKKRNINLTPEDLGDLQDSNNCNLYL